NPETNVFTNEAFGSEESENELDMNSLFTVDTQAIQNAFGFDEKAISQGMAGALDMSDVFADRGSSMDLSGFLDLSKIQIDLPGSADMNMGDMMGEIKIPISEDGMEQMASGLLAGYEEYIKTHPDEDYSKLGEYFQAYLATPEAQEILKSAMADIIKDNGNVTASKEQLQAMMKE